MKEPFTEKHVQQAKHLIMGRIKETTANTIYFITSAKITSQEIREIHKIGFEQIEVSPISNFAVGVLLIWRKELPAYVKEGVEV